jgi:hypothetical protein
VKGLAAADITPLIGFAGFIAAFFFLTLYMQNVLGYSPIKSGLAFLPVAIGVGVVAPSAPGSSAALEPGHSSSPTA